MAIAWSNSQCAGIDAAARDLGAPTFRLEVTDPDAAEAVCFLASERAGFIMGQKLDVDGGYGV